MLDIVAPNIVLAPTADIANGILNQFYLAQQSIRRRSDPECTAWSNFKATHIRLIFLNIRVFFKWSVLRITMLEYEHWCVHDGSRRASYLLRIHHDVFRPKTQLYPEGFILHLVVFIGGKWFFSCKQFTLRIYPQPWQLRRCIYCTCNQQTITSPLPRSFPKGR